MDERLGAFGMLDLRGCGWSVSDDRDNGFGGGNQFLAEIAVHCGWRLLIWKPKVTIHRSSVSWPRVLVTRNSFMMPRGRLSP